MRTSAPLTASLSDALHAIAAALEACAQALKQLADAPAPAADAGPPVPYLPIKRFCQHYPLYTEAALRSLVFHRQTNGLHTAVIQIERKLLIDVAAFFHWVEQHKQSGQPAAGIIIPSGSRRRRIGTRKGRVQRDNPRGRGGPS